MRTTFPRMPDFPAKKKAYEGVRTKSNFGALGMCKTGMVSVVLLCLISWSTPVMSAEEQVAEAKVSETESDFECELNEGWTPTQAELEKILADHLEWLDLKTQNFNDLYWLKLKMQDSDPRYFNDERRANLCNANLRGSAPG